MRLIDKTPYLSEKGQINLIDRLQSLLQFGPSWFQQLDAQKVVVSRLEKQLDNRYMLMRNVTLPNSDIMLPLILLGPQGIYLLNVTHLRGVYQAKNEDWGTLEGEVFKPASINLLVRTARLGRALEVYLKRQGHEAQSVEPVLVAADPGLHVDSVRPIVRVVLSDAIDRFAASLKQAQPVLSTAAILDLVERIQSPRQKSEEPSAEPAPAAKPPAPQAPADRRAPVFDPHAQGFGQPEEPAAPGPEPEAGYDTGMPYFDAPPETPPAPPKKKGGFLGMSGKQAAALGCMGLFWVCAIAGFIAYLFLTNQIPLP